MQHILKIYKPYFSQVLKLSYPIIIGQIGIVLMGVADVIMVGHLDATNLAAAGLANSVFFLVSILGIGTLTAISPLVAKAKGAGHNNEVALFFRQGLWASLLLSIFISAFMFVFTVNLEWFGQDEEVTQLTKPYLHILNAGIVFMLLFMAAKQFSDGLSFTKPAAVITIIGLIVNVLLCWIFIYGNWGSPAMGLNGAGYATTITRLLMAVAMIVYVLKHPLYKVSLHVKEKAGSYKLLKQIFAVGLPSGFQYFFEAGAFASAAIIIGLFGKNELAAHQIAINLASVTYMIATGLSVGGSIAVGDAWGRKDKQSMIRSGNAALIMSVVFMFITALIFAVFNQFFVSLYTKDIWVAEMAAKLLLIAALFQLSDGVQCVSLGILRGLADTKVPTLITVVAYWVIGLPVGCLLAYQTQVDFYGIWYGLSLGLTFSAIMLSVRFIKESKSFNFVEEEKAKYEELVHG